MGQNPTSCAGRLCSPFLLSLLLFLPAPGGALPVSTCSPEMPLCLSQHVMQNTYQCRAKMQSVWRTKRLVNRHLNCHLPLLPTVDFCSLCAFKISLMTSIAVTDSVHDSKPYKLPLIFSIQCYIYFLILCFSLAFYNKGSSPHGSSKYIPSALLRLYLFSPSSLPSAMLVLSCVLCS